MVVRFQGFLVAALLRSINKAGRIWGHGFAPKVIWAIVKANAKSCGLPSVAPHDLRKTCARLCHQAGGELDQIQFLLGHVSIQTTERYLGCNQHGRLRGRRPRSDPPFAGRILRHRQQDSNPMRPQVRVFANSLFIAPASQQCLANVEIVRRWILVTVSRFGC